MSHDRDALGGPAAAIAAIQQAAAAGKRGDNPAGTGIIQRGDLPAIEELDTSNVARGVLAEFVYLPSLPATGLLNPGPTPSPTGGLYAGAVYRHVLGQRLIGWTDRGNGQFAAPAYSTQPQDGFSGTLTGLGGGGQNPVAPSGLTASDVKGS